MVYKDYLDSNTVYQTPDDPGSDFIEGFDDNGGYGSGGGTVTSNGNTVQTSAPSGTGRTLSESDISALVALGKLSWADGQQILENQANGVFLPAETVSAYKIMVQQMKSQSSGLANQSIVTYDLTPTESASQNAKVQVDPVTGETWVYGPGQSPVKVLDGVTQGGDLSNLPNGAPPVGAGVNRFEYVAPGDGSFYVWDNVNKTYMDITDQVINGLGGSIAATGSPLASGTSGGTGGGSSGDTSGAPAMTEEDRVAQARAEYDALVSKLDQQFADYGTALGKKIYPDGLGRGWYYDDQGRVVPLTYSAERDRIEPGDPTTSTAFVTGPNNFATITNAPRAKELRDTAEYVSDRNVSPAMQAYYDANGAPINGGPNMIRATKLGPITAAKAAEFAADPFKALNDIYEATGQMLTETELNAFLGSSTAGNKDAWKNSVVNPNDLGKVFDNSYKSFLAAGLSEEDARWRAYLQQISAQNANTRANPASLNSTEKALYSYAPNLFTGLSDKYGDLMPLGFANGGAVGYSEGEAYPAYPGIPFNPSDPNQGARIAAAISQGGGLQGAQELLSPADRQALSKLTLLATQEAGGGVSDEQAARMTAQSVSQIRTIVEAMQAGDLASAMRIVRNLGTWGSISDLLDQVGVFGDLRRQFMDLYSQEQQRRNLLDAQRGSNFYDGLLMNPDQTAFGPPRNMFERPVGSNNSVNMPPKEGGYNPPPPYEPPPDITPPAPPPMQQETNPYLPVYAFEDGGSITAGANAATLNPYEAGAFAAFLRAMSGRFNPDVQLDPSQVQDWRGRDWTRINSNMLRDLLSRYGVPGFASGGAVNSPDTSMVNGKPHLTLDEPAVLTGMKTGKPYAIAAEAGTKEMVSPTPDGGLEFTPTNVPLSSGGGQMPQMGQQQPPDPIMEAEQSNDWQRVAMLSGKPLSQVLRDAAKKRAAPRL